MMRVVLILLGLMVCASAVAQQQPDVSALQKAIAVLQSQRNQAMDALASAEVQRATLAEEIEKLKARIAELEKPVK
jgi:predicted  nucleic acid-binding Zn-ribbon protein